VLAQEQEVLPELVLSEAGGVALEVRGQPREIARTTSETSREPLSRGASLQTLRTYSFLVGVDSL
jgi:hypothetical protein